MFVLYHQAMLAFI